MFQELKNKLLEGLKTFVTAENTDSVTNLCKLVEEMGQEQEALQNENTRLKDKIVDVVSGTMFNQKPKEIVEKEKSFDEIFNEIFNKKE